jgi:hypothetical protein
MSESELVRTLAAVVRSTNRNAADVTVARAIVTGLSAAGYEIVRARPGAAADDQSHAERHQAGHAARKAG